MLQEVANGLSSLNNEVGKLNQTLSTYKQNKIATQNYSAKTESPFISEIRNNLPFADIEFTFPVTSRHSGVRLPAFLTSHSDNFSAQWNPTTVYGRADPIPIYRNTTRSITLGFKIPNFDVLNANDNFKALGVLIKNLYPVYKSFGSADSLGAVRDIFSGLSPNQSIVGAPLARIKFANLICNSDNPDFGLLGYITSIGITMDVQSGFLIYYDEQSQGENESLLFPRSVNFSLSFTPLHEHKIGWSTSSSWLGKNIDNYPFRTSGENAAQNSSQNLAGAIINRDASGIIGSVFGG